MMHLMNWSGRIKWFMINKLWRTFITNRMIRIKIRFEFSENMSAKIQICDVKWKPNICGMSKFKYALVELPHSIHSYRKVFILIIIITTSFIQRWFWNCYWVPPATAADISLMKRRSPSSEEVRFLIKERRLWRGMLFSVRKASWNIWRFPAEPLWVGWRVSRWVTFPLWA